MHYRLLVLRKEGMGSHNVTSSDIPENHACMRNQDISTPQETDNASDSNAHQREREAHQHVFTHYV